MERNFVVASTAKNESKYLLEWIAFHRVVGVDHFYIYDNEGTDETGLILSALEKHGLATRIVWPSPTNVSKNVGAYIHFFENFKEAARWVAIIDCDEFLVPRDDNDLPAVLNKFDNFSGVAFHWKVFGSAGQEHYENQTCMTRFMKCGADSFHGNRHVKSIVRSSLLKFPNVHISDMKAGFIVDADYETVPYECRGLREKVTFSQVQINHYFCKSSEEWVWKKNRGRSGVSAGASDNIRPDSMFQSMDQNGSSDFEILRFYNKTVDGMVRLSNLCGLQDFLPADARPALRRSRTSNATS